MRKSVKKYQSQVQTIQRTVPSRNTTQANRNINNFWKCSLWFCIQCLSTFCYFLQQNQENGCLENCICVRAFKRRPVPIDQVLCTRMLCLLQSWQFQLAALPMQTIQRAQNTEESTLMCSFKYAHISINPHAKMCLKAFCSKK